MKKFYKTVFIPIILIAYLFCFCGCAKSNPVSQNAILLDTSVTVTLYDFGEENPNEIIGGVFELCRYYENLFSRTIENSDIYKINHSEGKAVEVSPETAELIEKALYYCSLSEGKFDITLLPVSLLWDFNGENPRVPDEAELKEALKYVDYTLVKVEGNSVTVPKGVQIDLGAIAKGYIADKMAEYLKKEGVSSAILDLGGNIYALGDKRGENWKIGIRSPFDPGEQIGYTEVKDKTVVTSGVYERCFKKDGKLYHHILNTENGMPVDNGVASVTIIAQSSADADALSTLCFALGKDKGLEVLNNTEGVCGIFVMTGGEIFKSDGTDFR